MHVNAVTKENSYFRSISKDGCTLDEITAKAVGKAYQDKTAQPGYQYYVLFLHVTNGGTDTILTDNMGFYPAGLMSGDVIDKHLEERTEKSTAFLYNNSPVIPAGEDVVIPYEIQVKKGVKEIKAYYYGISSKEEAQEIQIGL